MLIFFISLSFFKQKMGRVSFTWSLIVWYQGSVLGPLLFLFLQTLPGTILLSSQLQWPNFCVGFFPLGCATETPDPRFLTRQLQVSHPKLSWILLSTPDPIITPVFPLGSPAQSVTPLFCPVYSSNQKSGSWIQISPLLLPHTAKGHLLSSLLLSALFAIFLISVY